MAFRRKIGRLADTYLDYYLKNKSAEKQSELVKQRQLEVNEQRLAEQAQQADLNRQIRVLEDIARDPTGRVARNYQRAGVQVNGYDLEGFIPSEDEILGNLNTEHIQKADTLQEIPTDMEALLANTSREGMAKDPRHVERLLGSARQRQDFIGRMTPTKVEGVDDTGEKTAEFVPSDELVGQTFQTERTANQEASRQGQIASAETGARLRAEGRFYSSEEGKALLNTKAQAALSQARSQAEGAAIVKATEVTGRFLPNVYELKKKWEQASPEIQRLVDTGVLNSDNLEIIEARGIQALPLTAQEMLSPAVRQYFEMRSSYMPIFARVLSEVGNLNEQEQLRAVGLAPSAIDALNGGSAGTEKLDRMIGLLVSMPDVQRALFAAQNLPPEQRMGVIEQIIDQAVGRSEDAAPQADPVLQGALDKIKALRGSNGRN